MQEHASAGLYIAPPLPLELSRLQWALTLQGKESSSFPCRNGTYMGIQCCPQDYEYRFHLHVRSRPLDVKCQPIAKLPSSLRFVQSMSRHCISKRLAATGTDCRAFVGEATVSEHRLPKSHKVGRCAGRRPQSKPLSPQRSRGCREVSLRITLTTHYVLISRWQVARTSS